MKHVIIGTAGHVDHGKTLLVKALTGIDTDRLTEEKKRGITIELGFAHLDFDDGSQAGIVDVPGHEKFIKNMLAGAGGIDLAMLVVAADEGFMPQTVEHLGILSLLGIRDGLVVLTKCDMVDPEWVEMVREDVKAQTAGTFLEGKPVHAVSARTGEGLQELKKNLQELVRQASEKNLRIPFRLPIDRVFSVEGFGTVVTGTLIEGALAVGDMAEVLPTGFQARVRNLQVHGKDVPAAYAGQRVAVNLAGTKKSDLARGDTIAKPGSVRKSLMLDVKLQNLKNSQRTILSGSQLHLYHGSSVRLCKVVLLDREALAPGESCCAQLRMTEELAAKCGDRFVVRFYSPLETIGGGVVLEPNPSIHRRFQETVVEALKRKESGSSSDIIEMHIREHGDGLATQTGLAKLTALSSEEVAKALEELKGTGEILLFTTRKDVFAWHTGSERLARQKITDALFSYEGRYPYRYGMKKAEVQVTFLKKMKPVVFDRYVEYLEQQGAVRRHEEYLCTPDYQVRKDELYLRVSNQLLDTVKKAEYDFVRYSDMSFAGVPKETADDILNILLEERRIVKVSDDLYTLTEYMERAKEMIQGEFAKRQVITTAEVRDLFQTSRKSAKPIIEYMDSIKVTKRAGAESERVAYS